MRRHVVQHEICARPLLRLTFLRAVVLLTFSYARPSCGSISSASFWLRGCYRQSQNCSHHDYAPTLVFHHCCIIIVSSISNNPSSIVCSFGLTNSIDPVHWPRTHLDLFLVLHFVGATLHHQHLLLEALTFFLAVLAALKHQKQKVFFETTYTAT